MHKIPEKMKNFAEFSPKLFNYPRKPVIGKFQVGNFSKTLFFTKIMNTLRVEFLKKFTSFSTNRGITNGLDVITDS